MDRASFGAWLDRYVEAWRTYDRAAIGDLFTEDAEYRFHPFDPPVRGRAAIVAAWLESPDAPGSWRCHYSPYAVEGGDAVAHGWTEYLVHDGETVDRRYANAYLCRFSPDGRCASFTEYYVPERPRAEAAAPAA